MKFLHLFYVPGYTGYIQTLDTLHVSQFILLLCENCINLNYVELVHGAFQV